MLTPLVESIEQSVSSSNRMSAPLTFEQRVLDRAMREYVGDRKDFLLGFWSREPYTFNRFNLAAVRAIYRRLWLTEVLGAALSNRFGGGASPPPHPVLVERGE